MRIHSIEAIPIEIPLGRNFGGSTYTVLKRCTVVTRMRTDEGLVSEVYNGDNREHGREIVRLIHDELAPRVRGRSLFEGERIWNELFALTHGTRDPKTLLEAIACVDCFFFSSRRRHTRLHCDWSSDVCSSDLKLQRLKAEANRCESQTLSCRIFRRILLCRLLSSNRRCAGPEYRQFAYILRLCPRLQLSSCFEIGRASCRERV